MAGNSNPKPKRGQDQPTQSNQIEPGTAMHLESERLRLEREHEAMQRGMRSIFEVGFPPAKYQGMPGYNTHVELHKDNLELIDRRMYERNPELLGLPHQPISIETDGSEVDGLVQQCKAHLKVWEEPCLERLSDIVKKSRDFKIRAIIREYQEYQLECQNLPYQGIMQRHYIMPAGHTESYECSCISCSATGFSAESILEMGHSGGKIIDYIVLKATERLRVVFLSEVKLAFQVESRANLVEYLVNALQIPMPLIVAMRFEEFFKKIYAVGVEMAYEILKHVAPLFRQQWNYDAAYRFIRFWIEVHNRIALTLTLINPRLHAFEWKLQKCQINFRAFFWQFISHFVYDVEEFQQAFRASLNIVARERKCWGSPRREFTNRQLIDCIRDINTTLIEAKMLWAQRKLPFDFVETKLPKWNMFRMIQIRNPYTAMEPNVQEAYHVVECPKTGNLLYRRLDNDSQLELELSLPIVDIVIAKPGSPDAINGSRFNIRVFKKPARLSPSETQDAIMNGDVPFLHAHGVSTVYKSSGARYINDVYLKRRRDHKLDDVEGPLKPRLMALLTCHSREEARKLIRAPKQPKRRVKKFRVFCFPKRSRYTCYVRGVPRPIRCVVRHETMRAGARHHYRFGDIRYRRPDPVLKLYDAQRQDFLTDAVSAALMQATDGLEIFGPEEPSRYKYYVAIRYIKRDAEGAVVPPMPRPAVVSDEQQIRDMTNVLKEHYDTQEQYELMSSHEALESAQGVERAWAKGRQQQRKEAYAISKGIDPKLLRPPKASNAPQQIDPATQPRPAPQGSAQMLPPQSKVPPAAGVVTKKPVTVTKSAADSSTRPNPYDTRMRPDGAAAVGGSNGDGGPAVASAGVRVMNHTGQTTTGRSVSKGDLYCNAPATPGAATPRKAPAKGLPVNTGYAKTRQHLREKLKREKTQAQQQTQQGQQVAAGAGPIEKKKPANETVTTNEHPNGTMDVDELVENIEGLNIDKKGDPKKKAKRARQKEKREQTQKALEEQAKLEAEEKRKAEEAEQLLREEAEREEEARKKREKKKKRKKKGKEEAQASQPDGSAKTESIPGLAARAANSILKPTLLPGTQAPSAAASSSSGEPAVPLLPSSGKTVFQRSLSNDTSSVKSASTTACNGNGSAETTNSKNKNKKKKKKTTEAKSETSQSEASDSGSISDESELMPPPGAGVYNQDSNMIVMNPDYNDEDDELAGYNSDDYYYGRKQPAKFEEVISSKTKRQRSKANKTEEKEEDKTYNGSGDLKPYRETTPGGASNPGNKGKRRADTGPRGNNTNTSAEKSRKGNKVPNKSAGSPAFSSSKIRTGPSASTSNMAPRHIKARAEAQQQQQMAQKALQLGASASTVRPQTSDFVVPPSNSWVRSATSVDYSHVEKAASTTPDSQSSGGFALYGDSHNAPAVRDEFQFSGSSAPAFSLSQSSVTASSTSGMNCVGADGNNYPFASGYSSQCDQGSDLGPVGSGVEFESSSWNREDVEFLNQEPPEFSAAVSRPVPAARPSPNQLPGAPYKLPGAELANFANSYYGKEKPSTSTNANNWGWNTSSDPPTPPHNRFSPYSSDNFQQAGRFSPTPRLNPGYAQSSPLRHPGIFNENRQQGILNEPRLFSVSQAQTLPPSPMGQNLPNFEPHASSSSMRNINRPEALAGNNYPYTGSNATYSGSNMFGNPPEVDRVARNPNHNRPNPLDVSAFGAAAQNYQNNQRRYGQHQPAEPQFAPRNDYGNFGNYNAPGDPVPVQPRVPLDVNILRLTESVVGNRQKVLDMVRAGELPPTEDWGALLLGAPRANPGFLPPHSNSDASPPDPFAGNQGFLAQAPGAMTDHGEARLRDLGRSMFGELGQFVNLHNAEGRAQVPAPNNQPDQPPPRNEYSLF